MRKEEAKSNDKDWIVLNVGGTYFSTHRSTLTKGAPASSPLHRISSNSTMVDWDRDERGAYLIDRDPTFFQPVLNFLRNGRLVLGRDIPEEAILLEAEYFNLPRLAELVKERINKNTKNMNSAMNSFQPFNLWGNSWDNMQPPMPQPILSKEFLTNCVNDILADDTMAGNSLSDDRFFKPPTARTFDFN